MRHAAAFLYPHKLVCSKKVEETAAHVIIMFKIDFLFFFSPVRIQKYFLGQCSDKESRFSSFVGRCNSSVILSSQKMSSNIEDRAVFAHVTIILLI